MSWKKLIICAAVAAMACSGRDDSLREIQRVQSGDLDVVLLSDDGALNHGKEAFVVEFQRANGDLVDVGTVKVAATMPMPGTSPMLGDIRLDPAGAPGRYMGTSDLGMVGGWLLAIEWDGPAGRGSASLNPTIQ
jgi:hypothetical protein